MAKVIAKSGPRAKRRTAITEGAGEQIEAVLEAARRSGLLTKKSSRIAGRVSPVLIKQAKRRTGIQTDTDLIEFALASVALEDEFAKVFRQVRGKIPAGVKLGF